MTYAPDRHHRRSMRLQGYDYALAGAYFVTVCVQDRACLLGEVVDGETRLASAGAIVQAGWVDLPRRFPGIETDAFVVMPNHVHGIVFLRAMPDADAISERRTLEQGAMNRAPTTGYSDPRHDASNQDVPNTLVQDDQPVGARFIAPSFPTPTPRLSQPAHNRGPASPKLGDVIRTFKAVTTRQIRTESLTSFTWQRNDDERVIRNDPKPDRAYISAHPPRRLEDAENPARGNA